MDEPLPIAQSIGDITIDSSTSIPDPPMTIDSLPAATKAATDTQHVPAVPSAPKKRTRRTVASVKPEPISDEPLPALASTTERKWVHTPTHSVDFGE